MDLRSETAGGVVGVHPADGRMPSRSSTMLPIQIICPECTEGFEADPLALEYRCP